MNKSIKKCCICSNSETGEFIMIGDNKYHLSCIEKMQKENQQLKEQQKEFIDYLEKEIVDSRAGSSQYYSAMQHLKLFKEIIGSDK